MQHFQSKILNFLFYIVFMLTAWNAQADVINVPGDVANIQDAINQISAGGTVNIAAGTFPLTAQLVINKNLTLNGAGIDSTIIQSPDTVDLTNTFTYTGVSTATYTPVIIVKDASDVILQNFTVDGRDQSVFGVIAHFTGVGYHNASGTVSSLHVLNIMESTEPTGYQEGTAILNANDTGSNTILIEDCVVDHFQKQGILAIGADLTFTIDSNNVLGVNVEANPNGIEAYDGSTGVISNNMINNLSNPLTMQSTGILIFNGDNVSILNNTVTNSDNGIYLYDCNNSIANGNDVTNNFNNITVDDTAALIANTHQFNSNIMSNSTALSAPSFGLQLFSPPSTLINPLVFLDSNVFDSSNFGMVVNGNTTDTAGPIVRMHDDTFLETFANSTYYIQMVSCPNDIWPSSDTVSFNGLVSGVMTQAQFDTLVTNPITQQIYDKNTDPTLGLVLTYVVPAPPTVTNLIPDSGPFTGGTSVTITGTNFVRGTQVFFGGVPATNVDVISSTMIIVISPPGTGTVPVTVTTPNGTVNAGNFTYIGSLKPLPPVDFRGIVKKNVFLNQKEFRLIANWDPSPSPDVAAYNIYKNGVLVSQVLATSPLVFTACLRSKNDVNFQITAVGSDGLESSPVTLRIIK